MATQDELIDYLKKCTGSIKTDILEKVEEIEKLLNKVSSHEESANDNLICRAKQLVDTISEKSSNFKSEFYKKYSKISTKDSVTLNNQVNSPSEYESAADNSFSFSDDHNDIVEQNDPLNITEILDICASNQGSEHLEKEPIDSNSDSSVEENLRLSSDSELSEQGNTEKTKEWNKSASVNKMKEPENHRKRKCKSSKHNSKKDEDTNSSHIDNSDHENSNNSEGTELHKESIEDHSSPDILENEENDLYSSDLNSAKRSKTKKEKKSFPNTISDKEKGLENKEEEENDVIELEDKSDNDLENAQKSKQQSKKKSKKNTSSNKEIIEEENEEIGSVEKLDTVGISDNSLNKDKNSETENKKKSKKNLSKDEIESHKSSYVDGYVSGDESGSDSNKEKTSEIPKKKKSKNILDEKIHSKESSEENVIDLEENCSKDNDALEKSDQRSKANSSAAEVDSEKIDENEKDDGEKNNDTLDNTEQIDETSSERTSTKNIDKEKDVEEIETTETDKEKNSDVTIVTDDEEIEENEKTANKNGKLLKNNEIIDSADKSKKTNDKESVEKNSDDITIVSDVDETEKNEKTVNKNDKSPENNETVKDPNKSKKSKDKVPVDSEDVVIKDEVNEDQNKENIPKIRLVSIDKLMATPKKSVTFDTSIIILTSSDEESPPPPKKSSEEAAAKNISEQWPTLKSALKKTSIDNKKTEDKIKEVKGKKNSRKSDDSEKEEENEGMSRKSRRLKSKVMEKKEEHERLKSSFEKKKMMAAQKEEKNKGRKTRKVVDVNDSSDEDDNREQKSKKSESKSVKDKMFCEVYISLPRVECCSLPEVCSKEDNIFSIECLVSRRSKSLKRLRGRDSDSSSDSENTAGNKPKRRKERNSSSDEDDRGAKDEAKSPPKSKEADIDVDEEAAADGDGDESKDFPQKGKDKVTKKELTIKLENISRNGLPVEQTNTKSLRSKMGKDSDAVQIVTSDSEDDFLPKKKIIASESKQKKKKKKKILISDSENSGEDNDKKSDEASSDENSSNSHDSDKEKTKKKINLKRIKKSNSSSESDDPTSTRKQIRRVIGRDSLSETTKKAEADEKERKARIAEKQKKYNAIFDETKDANVEKVVLEIDEKTKKELLAVDPRIVKKLKPHQASGIRFMWDACFESLDRAKNTPGSGCIIAHCMGLGKTLQVIGLTHTLLENTKKTGVSKVLVVCPVNTVINWKNEYKRWMPKKTSFDVFELVSCKQMYEKRHRVAEWHEDGGVLIIGYSMFRNISNPDNKKVQKKVRETFIQGLVDPGPDLVVCDEGHLLKNEKTHLSIAMNRIKTARRIVLTGTPLQNNLKEYWCMVQFIKPNLLGTYKEYLNRFVNPITNGQYTDSTQHDIVLMRKRSHVLHKLLDGVVQRRDYSVLEPYLPPKHEYVLFVRLSDVQVKLYKHYIENYARKSTGGSNKISFLFVDFQQLQRICTHPRVLLDKSTERKDKLLDDEEESEGSLKDFIDDGEVSGANSSSSSSGSSSDSDSDNSKKGKKTKNKKQQKTRVTRAQAAARAENGEDSESEIIEVAPKEWWQDFCDGDELDNINNSGKMSLLFHLLRECEEIGDKILIFSQSLYTLNCIEYFLAKIDEATRNGESEKFGGYSGTWDIGLDYFRLDGSSSCENRAYWCDMFNSPDNTRARLFLISTKAGGLGINLVAANRVIIFDVSWNPSHDIQSIYRVYRFGQTKPCYIYRFVTYGGMEMKIYERQVTKQAISKRVIDEQQIDRHYNQNDLQELYRCEVEPDGERPIPLVPKDVLLGEMLQKYDKILYKYHEHQTLLENKAEECLNEEERKAAWEEFENEKELRKNTSANMGTGLMGINAQLMAAALANIVRRDNPTWSEIQVQGIIPALVAQLRVQLLENDRSMYNRVIEEIQRMQTEAREAQFQRQMMQMFAQNQYMQAAQQQWQQNNNMGNLQINHSSLRNIYNNMYLPPSYPGSTSGRPRAPQTPSNDVIELND